MIKPFQTAPAHSRSHKHLFLVILMLAAVVFSTFGAALLYPYLKSSYMRLKGHVMQTFLDVTDSAGLSRHDAGANWLGTFSVSAVDYDNDGDIDLFVNNHERHRPYFYRNNGDKTFSEVHEEIGILENSIGSVFGAPRISPDSPGFFIWLDPATRISGTWHIRWIGPAGAGVNGTLTTNTKIESVRPVNLAKGADLEMDSTTLQFSSTADGTIRGIDFTSSFPESTVQFDLRYDGKTDPTKVFVGPKAVHPHALPLVLGLGDRHATIWGDYNNDGRSDLFITRGAMVGTLKPPHGAKDEELFRNSPAGFSNAIKAAGIRNDYGRGRDAQWVDYDNDGHLDLYVSNLGDKNLLFRNRGDGTFEEVAPQAGLDLTGHTHFVWADFNQDGHSDILFANPLRLFLNNGKGRFYDATEASGLIYIRRYENFKNAMFWGSGAAVADFNNDGTLDVFVASGLGGGDSRLFERRAGEFVDVTQQAGLAGLHDVIGAIWGDFDNDGRVDLYTISQQPNSNRLFRNVDGRSFKDVTLPMNLSLTDRSEWLPSTHAGWAATWVDYDGDGFLDLFLATRRPKTAHIRQNEPAAATRSLFAALLSRLQPYMKGKSAGTHFLFKNTGNDNHWIRIKLTGKTSNRSGYGAKVFVATGNSVQFQEAGTSGKILFAQNDVPLHFGLGRFDKVDQIRVIWPSGHTQVLEHVPARQVVTINEVSSKPD